MPMIRQISRTLGCAVHPGVLISAAEADGTA